jgi:two-component system sensor histidine kinase ChvG
MLHKFAQRVRTFYRTLAVRIIVLAIVFLVVPIILYRLFQLADAQQSELLEHAVEQKGDLIASVVKPHLANFQNELPDDLQRTLDQLVDAGSSIRILVRAQDRAASSAYLYVAAAPAVTADFLDQERDQLLKLGVLDKLGPTCEGEMSRMVRFINAAGRPEVLTSVTPVHIENNCWVVITSESTQAILSSPIGQPAWSTPTVHIAGLVYLLSAVIVAWLFVDIWRNINRFRTTARKISIRGAGRVSFRDMNTIPELTGVADDFDSLVKALKQSKEFIVQAAEENAHAFKAPLAVIAQAIEPLKRMLPEDDPQARRSIELIERSTARLDFLVSAARDLEQATADAISTHSRPINLSSSLMQLIAAYHATLTAEGKHLQSTIDHDVRAYATEEALESIIENLLENAASFTERDGTVTVMLKSSDGYAHLTVADNGPGVPKEHLPMIFDRHFSARAQPEVSTTNLPLPTDNHYGLGLWIVWRNVQALGGQVSARNRDGGGLAVTASFRAAL